MTRPPAVVLAVTVFWVTVMAAFALLVPSYAGPDEQFHVDLVVGVADEHRWWEFDGRNLSQQVYESERVLGGSFAYRHLDRSAALPRGHRPTFGDLSPRGPSAIGNHLTVHPPLYYFATGAAVDAITLAGGADAWSVDRVNLLARWLNVLLLAPIPYLAWLAARRARLSDGTATVAAAVPLLIPQLLYVGAVVNNDNLLTLIGALLLVAVLPVVADGDRSLGRAAVVGLLVGLGLLTKGFAIALPLWVFAAYGLAWWRRGRQAAATAVLPIAVSGAVAFAVGGWWWLRNLLVTGSPMPVIQPGGFEPIAGAPVDLGRWAFYMVREIAETGISEFQGLTLDHPLIWLLVGGLVLAAGISLLPGGRRRLELSVAAAAFASVYGTVAFFTLRGHLANGNLRGFQGRYVFTAATALVVLVAAGAVRVARSADRVRTVIVAGGVVLEGYAGWLIFRASWAPDGAAVGERLRTLAAWSALPPVLTVGVLVAPLVTAGWLLWASARTVTVESDEDAGAIETATVD